VIVDTFELVCLRIEFRQTVARTENDSEQLRDAEHEVNQLRDEEEQHCLTEVA
jgi:hypothetical protein